MMHELVSIGLWILNIFVISHKGHYYFLRIPETAKKLSSSARLSQEHALTGSVLQLSIDLQEIIGFETQTFGATNNTDKKEIKHSV
jgi:hypothetical protein